MSKRTLARARVHALAVAQLHDTDSSAEDIDVEGMVQLASTKDSVQQATHLDDGYSSSDEEEAKPARKRGRSNSAPAAKATNQRKKKQSKNLKQAQDKKGTRIGGWRAKQRYSLDDSDLAKMQDVKRQWSFMGLNTMYSPRELEEYARKKHAGNEAFEGHLQAKLQAQEARKARKREDRAAANLAAVQAVTQYGERNTALQVDQYGDTKLPDEVLVRIMECLADRRSGGRPSYAFAATSLANASLANWDCYRAAKAGFKALAEEAKATSPPEEPYGAFRYGYGFGRQLVYGGTVERLPGPPALGGWSFWEGLLADPLSLTSDQLKQAMRVVGLTPKGTKAEMALRVLGVFGLKAATSTPVQLLQKVRLERLRGLA